MRAAVQRTDSSATESSLFAQDGKFRAEQSIFQLLSLKGKNMNWDAIGAIGEVVGALGVICTLAYLAVQIRQNTESVKTSTVQAMLEASASFSDLCASHEELGRIFITGIQSRSSLSKEEKVRFHYLMTSYIRRIEAEVV